MCVCVKVEGFKVISENIVSWKECSILFTISDVKLLSLFSSVPAGDEEKFSPNIPASKDQN